MHSRSARRASSPFHLSLRLCPLVWGSEGGEGDSAGEWCGCAESRAFSQRWEETALKVLPQLSPV